MKQGKSCQALLSLDGTKLDSTGYMSKVKAEQLQRLSYIFGAMPYTLTAAHARYDCFLTGLDAIRPRIEALEQARQALSDAELKETQCENEEPRRRELERKLAQLQPRAGQARGTAGGGDKVAARVVGETPSRRSKRHAEAAGEQDEDGATDENDQQASSKQKRKRRAAVGESE